MKMTPPAKNQIGAEVTDFDVRKATSDDALKLREAVYDHKLVVLREQHDLTNEEYIGFAKLLGRPQVYFQDNYHHPDHPEIFVSSNVPDEEGKKVGVAGTGQYWHTDYQFDANPLSFTLLQPKILPEGDRATYYIDMERVYAEMPAELKAYVDGRDAVHEGKYRYKITPDDIDRAVIDILAEVEKWVPPLKHPAVIEHPISRRKALYVSSGFTTGLDGVSYEQNQKLMPKLFAFVEQDKYVHTHRWEYGDILFWENRTLLHKASKTPAGQKSCSYRIGVYDELPFYEGIEAGKEVSMVS